MGFSLLDPMGYKCLSSFKEIGYKLLLIKIKKTAASFKSFTLIQLFICEFKFSYSDYDAYILALG